MYLVIHATDCPTGRMVLCTQELYTLYMATGLVREVAQCENLSQLPEPLPFRFHSRKHVTEGAEGSYYSLLIRSNLNFTLCSAVNRAGISNAHLLSGFGVSCCSPLYISCTNYSRCCCCLFLYNRQHMVIPLNSARGPGLYHRS